MRWIDPAKVGFGDERCGTEGVVGALRAELTMSDRLQRSMDPLGQRMIVNGLRSARCVRRAGGRGRPVLWRAVLELDGGHVAPGGLRGAADV